MVHVVDEAEICPSNSGSLRRQGGRDPDRWHEAARDVLRVLQRSDSARAGCAGGVHSPGADLHAGGDWEVGLRGALGAL